MKKLLLVLAIVLMTTNVWAGRALETVLETDYEIVIDTGEAGTLYLNETSTPTAKGSKGAIYTKSDNELYFQDGAGTEKRLKTGVSDYGEMGNVYGSSATETLESTDEWHAIYHTNITGSAPHLNNNFTFTVGSHGGGNITTAAAGAAINIADTAHGLTTGDFVTVQSANHAGVGTVTLVDADNFTVDIAYVGDEAATWQMGSYLTVSSAGVYRGVWNMGISQSATNSQTSIIAPFVNATQSTKAVAPRLVDNSSDIGMIGGNGLMSFSADDRIWFAVQSTSAQTLTFLVFNVTIH